MSITRADLDGIHDFKTSEALVHGAIRDAMVDYPTMLRFMGRYTSWNGFFGSGVATLSGKVGRSRKLFLDPGEPVLTLADRSVLIASYFFDAARDEFDDHDTEHRDTHRCLAQAVLSGIVLYGQQRALPGTDLNALNEELDIPLWLHALQDRVAVGYGARTADDGPGVFRAIGYHLASEVLADQEFSLIDQYLRDNHEQLVDFLQKTSVRIGEEDHNCYQWLHLHSGHGGGAEHDHFKWAVKGVNLALHYVPEDLRQDMRQQTFLGFGDFARDHRQFFQTVNEG